MLVGFGFRNLEHGVEFRHEEFDEFTVTFQGRVLEVREDDLLGLPVLRVEGDITVEAKYGYLIPVDIGDGRKALYVLYDFIPRNHGIRLSGVRELVLIPHFGEVNLPMMPTVSVAKILVIADVRDVEFIVNLYALGIDGAPPGEARLIHRVYVPLILYRSKVVEEGKGLLEEVRGVVEIPEEEVNRVLENLSFIIKDLKPRYIIVKSDLEPYIRGRVNDAKVITYTHNTAGEAIRVIEEVWGREVKPEGAIRVKNWEEAVKASLQAYLENKAVVITPLGGEVGEGDVKARFAELNREFHKKMESPLTTLAKVRDYRELVKATKMERLGRIQDIISAVVKEGEEVERPEWYAIMPYVKAYRHTLDLSHDPWYIAFMPKHATLATYTGDDYTYAIYAVAYATSRKTPILLVEMKKEIEENVSNLFKEFKDDAEKDMIILGGYALGEVDKDQLPNHLKPYAEEIRRGTPLATVYNTYINYKLGELRDKYGELLGKILGGVIERIVNEDDPTANYPIVTVLGSPYILPELYRRGLHINAGHISDIPGYPNLAKILYTLSKPYPLKSRLKHRAVFMGTGKKKDDIQNELVLAFANAHCEALNKELKGWLFDVDEGNDVAFAGIRSPGCGKELGVDEVVDYFKESLRDADFVLVVSHGRAENDDTCLIVGERRICGRDILNWEFFSERRPDVFMVSCEVGMPVNTSNAANALILRGARSVQANVVILPATVAGALFAYFLTGSYYTGEATMIARTDAYNELGSSATLFLINYGEPAAPLIIKPSQYWAAFLNSLIAQSNLLYINLVPVLAEVTIANELTPGYVDKNIIDTIIDTINENLKIDVRNFVYNTLLLVSKIALLRGSSLLDGRYSEVVKLLGELASAFKSYSAELGAYGIFVDVVNGVANGARDLNRILSSFQQVVEGIRQEVKSLLDKHEIVNARNTLRRIYGLAYLYAALMRGVGVDENDALGEERLADSLLTMYILSRPDLKGSIDSIFGVRALTRASDIYSELCNKHSMCGGRVGLKWAFTGNTAILRDIEFLLAVSRGETEGEIKEMLELVGIEGLLRFKPLKSLIESLGALSGLIEDLSSAGSRAVILDLGASLDRFPAWVDAFSDSVHVPEPVLKAVCDTAHDFRDIEELRNVVSGLEWVCEVLERVRIKNE